MPTPNIIPPRVPSSLVELSPFQAGLLRGSVGYGGDLLGLQVLTPTGWVLISTPADARPQAQSEDGRCQYCVSAAVDPVKRSIVQQAGSTAVLHGTTWFPQPSRPRQMDSLGAIGTAVGWSSWWELWDSVLGDTTPSPIWMQQTLKTLSEPARTWVRLEATFYRQNTAEQPTFLYERWNSPYLVLNGEELLGLIIDGVETSMAAMPVGSDAQPPTMATPLQSRFTLRCRCGRWLTVRGEGWHGIRFWRPHPKVFIVTAIINKRPVLPGSPVSLWWEMEAQ